MLAASYVACGDQKPPNRLDAAVDAPQATDAPPHYPACGEFATAHEVAMPAHVTGTLSGADLESPSSCTVVDAPYGALSAGPDSVIKLIGLTAGFAYVVRVVSVSDLAFYVATSCTTPAGPAATSCLLFEDAVGAGDEVGRFVASGPVAYVVVDYYASHPPADSTFTLTAYQEQCAVDLACGGATPVCEQGLCVECRTSFDCPSATKPTCDRAAHACVAGVDTCLSDDPGEPGNDGPSGAPLISVDIAGNGAVSGQICSSPASETDYAAFAVTAIGEVWDISLQWGGSRDLDLELFDAGGKPLGYSYWEHPERARLTFLPIGTYYIAVTEFSTSADPSPVSYSLSVHRQAGPGCTSTADCAGEYRNQIYRGNCEAGACVDIVGAGTVGAGGACDSRSDCASGLSCPSFYFTANADSRDLCAPGCIHDADCGGLGTSYVCTTYLVNNVCIQKCAADVQCPTSLGTPPSTGPWDRLSCDVPSGRCLP